MPYVVMTEIECVTRLVCHGYNKVGRILGRSNPKQHKFSTLEGHLVGLKHAEEARLWSSTVTMAPSGTTSKSFWSSKIYKESPYLLKHLVIALCV